MNDDPFALVALIFGVAGVVATIAYVAELTAVYSRNSRGR